MPPEIAQEIEKFNKSFEDFQKSTDARLRAVEDLAGKAAAVLRRPNIGGAPDTGGPATDIHVSKAVKSWLHGDAAEVKGLSTDSEPDGGFLVVAQLESEIDRYQAEVSGLRGAVRLRTIDSGDAYEAVLTVGPAAYRWVGEREARGKTDAPPLIKRRWPLLEVMAMPVATQRQLDDSATDVEQWLAESVGEAFGEAEETAILTGDDILAPRGILTYDTDASPADPAGGDVLQSVASGTDGEVTADSLVRIVHTLPARYRRGATWVMSRTTAGAVRLLKDLQDRFLWVDGLAAGQPDRLLGYPVIESEAMPDPASNAKSVLFGNLNQGYQLIERTGMRILRDPYTDKPNVLFYTTRRIGGGLRRADAIKVLELST